MGFLLGVCAEPCLNACPSFNQQVDVFSVKGSDIGDITKVIISHDNSGIGSAWHCQQVMETEGRLRAAGGMGT